PAWSVDCTLQAGSTDHIAHSAMVAAAARGGARFADTIRLSGECVIADAGPGTTTPERPGGGATTSCMQGSAAMSGHGRALGGARRDGSAQLFADGLFRVVERVLERAVEDAEAVALDHLHPPGAHVGVGGFGRDGSRGLQALGDVDGDVAALLD